MDVAAMIECADDPAVEATVMALLSTLLSAYEEADKATLPVVPLLDELTEHRELAAGALMDMASITIGLLERLAEARGYSSRAMLETIGVIFAEKP